MRKEPMGGMTMRTMAGEPEGWIVFDRSGAISIVREYYVA